MILDYLSSPVQPHSPQTWKREASLQIREDKEMNSLLYLSDWSAPS